MYLSRYLHEKKYIIFLITENIALKLINSARCCVKWSQEAEFYAAQLSWFVVQKWTSLLSPMRLFINRVEMSRRIFFRTKYIPCRRVEMVIFIWRGNMEKDCRRVKLINRIYPVIFKNIYNFGMDLLMVLGLTLKPFLKYCT